MSTRGIDLIAQERKRQIEVEGYSREEDIGQEDVLTQAAVCYTKTAYDVMYVSELSKTHLQPLHPREWPWDYSYFKPTGDPIRDLTKAGALIAAAIDALQANQEDV